MDLIKCPVCETKHEIGILCPECGFETHLYTDVPPQFIVNFEQERIDTAKRIRQELLDLRKRVETATAPVGFLITGKLVVYCLYEGINTFGAGIIVDDSQKVHYNNLLIPGAQLCPEHFIIEIKKGESEKKMDYSVSCPAMDGTGIYLTTLTQKIGAEETGLCSGDVILISGDAETIIAELKFRKNISR